MPQISLNYKLMPKEKKSKSPVPVRIPIRAVMEFPEAMQEVINNMQVRRRSWPAGTYGMLKDGMLIIHLEDGDHTWSVSEGDLFAEDWETV